MKPHYEQRCAGHCVDRRGAPRPGVTWVHLFGRTSWVCQSCADALGKAAGIPTASQLRSATYRREARQQLSLLEPRPVSNPNATPAPAGH